MTMGGISRSSASARLFHDFARNIILAQPAGHRVEEGAHLVLPLVQHAAHGGLIGVGFGNLLLGFGEAVSSRTPPPPESAFSR